jgi:hypothetical protein
VVGQVWRDGVTHANLARVLAGDAGDIRKLLQARGILPRVQPESGPPVNPEARNVVELLKPTDTWGRCHSVLRIDIAAGC